MKNYFQQLSLINILIFTSLCLNCFFIFDKFNIIPEINCQFASLRTSEKSLQISDSSRKLDASKKEKSESMRVIGERTHTDKIYHHRFAAICCHLLSLAEFYHLLNLRYDRYYPKFLRHLRNKPMKMFEVGFLLGQSYEMWVQYFPKGSVYFMDKGFSPDYWLNVMTVLMLVIKLVGLNHGILGQEKT